LSNTQRGAIVTELGQLTTQINSFAAGTTYNGIKLLSNVDGVRTAGSASVGLAASGTFGSVTTLDVANAYTGTYTFSTGTNTLTLTDGSRTQTISFADLPAVGSTTLSFNNLGVNIGVQATAVSGMSTGFNAALVGKTLTVSAGSVASLGFQIGASSTASGDSLSINTLNVSTLDSGYSSLRSLGYLVNNNYDTTGLANLATNTAATDTQWTTAFKALNGYVETALNDISSSRATLGATMNQLGFVNTTLQAQSANEQAARSTVVDTNFAAETAKLTKGQIMQQAATAMLAQANQMPNVILSLLK